MLRHYRRQACFLHPEGEQGTGEATKSDGVAQTDEIKIAAEDERAWDNQPTGARVAIRKIPILLNFPFHTATDILILPIPRWN